MSEMFKIIGVVVVWCLGLTTSVMAGEMMHKQDEQKVFEEAARGDWKDVFADECTGDWKKQWFLDGEIGTVKIGPDGMTLTAGPEFKNDAHHMVLWTKDSFEGDLRIEYDYTRLDSENRCVTILYVQATGSGKEPYTEDIAEWNELRKIPSMKTYYNHMNTYHISYAAFGNSGKKTKSYVRGRRYMPHKAGLKGTDLKPDYYFDDLFETGVKHHITVLKKARDLHMRIENPDGVTYCHLKNKNLPAISKGRIGLRHMFTRSALYRNIRISSPQQAGPKASGIELKMTPEEVVQGFEERVDAMFRAEAGKPLKRVKKKPPLGKGRGPYVRGYSYSIVAFAARCLYLDERLDEANAALVENAQYYLDNPLAICDRDSFHWHAEIVLRLLEMYGPKGKVRAGRITKETEAVMLKYMWIYTKKCSWLGKAEYKKSKTWHVYSSENHHAMDFTCHWHFAKYAKDHPDYRDMKCNDGATLAEHFEAWNEYLVEYCRERARRGICVEMRSDGYNSTLIKGFYNFYDFGDAKVRRAAGMFLDMYFAYWAEEQILGHMGGGGSRIKGNNAFTQSRKHGNAVFAWLYFAIGEQPGMSGHDVGALLSDYRPPAVVADIARDTEGRGRYEIRQRVQGLGKQGHTFPHMDRPDQRPNMFRTDGGGILRYSYCDPAFILGTPMTEARPHKDWVMISSQSRWQGVIFAGEGDPRIVPVPRAKNNAVAFNQFWSVQSKGSLVTQKLKTHKGAAEMMVWISARGLSRPVSEEDIVFVEAPGAYAAIRVAKGGFDLSERVFKGVKPEGRKYASPPAFVVTPADEYAPVILEVMAKREARSLRSFKARVKATSPKMEGSLLRYTTIYGDVLTLDTSYKKKPTINGEPVNYAPKKVFDSPFLNADYDAGVVTISKGKRKKVLDFRG